jgi:hypothetical protein
MAATRTMVKTMVAKMGGNDLGTGLKWFGISMMDTFGLNQFAPTASSTILQINPPVLDFSLQQANDE